jgi:hypothetical protein
MASDSLHAFSFRSVLKEKECWITAILAVLYCFPALFSGETFFYRDIYRHSLPQKHLLVELLRAGKLPLWDPYLYGGQPFLGNVNNVVLHPSNLLYLILPMFAALNLNIVFHMAGSGIAFYLLARALAFERAAALCGSMIFAFCGYSLSLVQFLGHQSALPLMPLMLLFWHLYLQKEKRGWFALTAVTGAIQIFAGAPEINLITFSLLLGWGLTYGYAKARFKQLQRSLLLFICIGGLAAIQMLPTLEMLRYSSRSLLTYQDFTVWSVHPKRFPEMLFPHFLGRTDALSPQSYWGKSLEGYPYTYILSIYFGAIPLVLSIVGLLRKNNAQKLPRATRVFFAVSIVIAIILSMGKHLAVFHFLYSYVPLIHWFRYPVKFLGILVLPIALLATHGFEELFVEKNISRGVLWSFLLLAASLGILALCFYASGTFAAAIQQFFFSGVSSETRSGLQNSFRSTALFWLAATAITFMLRTSPKTRWLSACVLLFLILDLFLSGLDLNPTAPKGLFAEPPPIVKLIRSQLGDQRLYRDEVPQVYRLKAPSNEVVWQNVWDLQILNYYTAALYDIPLIFHKDLDAMAQQSEVELKNAMDSVPWERRLPLLSAGAVSLVLTDQAVVTPGLKLLARLLNASNIPFYLYRNETAVPRVTFLTHAVAADTHADALKRMLLPEFDPRSLVVLETQDPVPDLSSCEGTKIEKAERGANSSFYIVDARCSGFLVFSEPYFSGWRASIDERNVPLFRANYLFSAIKLPAGKHRIERSYEPRSVWLGGSISLVFLTMMLFLIFPVKNRFLLRQKVRTPVSQAGN